MTPALAERKFQEVSDLHDSLEPHAATKEIALVQQSLRAAGFWLMKVAESTPRSVA